MNVKIHPSWRELFQPLFDEPSFEELVGFVRAEYTAARIYPPAGDIFRAFDRCPPDRLRVVVIGQDPYHGPGQANGLCFSVGDGVRFPPSLQNIFKEIRDEFSTPMPASGNLDRWADQGVLLLNSVLTVRAGQAASHAGKGWEAFTDGVVSLLNERFEGLAYLLWGSYAQRKGFLVDPTRNLVLRSAHPSPLSAHSGFFGNGHFRKTNDYLTAQGKTPIQW